MPELPEVEVTRRSLGLRLHGASVVTVRLGKPLRWPLGIDPATLKGSRIGDISRRGKYLWLPLQRAAEGAGLDGGLLLHLGMSGSLALVDVVEGASAHVHFEMVTSAGTLRLTDPRRFGAVVWSAGLDAAPAATLLARLGAEPFDEALTAAGFHAALQRRRLPIKSLLLGGQVVVGAGNIYACEALFRAGIDPRTRSDRIGPVRAARLLAGLRETLSRALQLGGSTLRDFRDAHGMAGAFQTEALVYGREGEACRRCGAPVRRIVQSQRSTFFCPACQRR